MGIFRRLSDLIKANVNDMIDRAEDPEKMVKQIILEMQTELTKATQNYGKAKASERLAEKKYLEAQKISSDWEAKAKMALSKGDQELAKQALARKVKADEDLNNYKEMYESISAQTDAIGDQVEVLRAKLEEAKSRQAMLIARSQMAEKFQKMEEKIERKEAEADAFTEIAGNNLAGGSGDDLRDSFEKLESDAKVDAELQRLMAEMNGGASAQNAE